jgi:hypothetical protein
LITVNRRSPGSIVSFASVLLSNSSHSGRASPGFSWRVSRSFRSRHAFPRNATLQIVSPSSRGAVRGL